MPNATVRAAAPGLPVSRRSARRAMGCRSRRAVEEKIEELIALLDTIDPDPDIEDGGDAEPDEDGELTGDEEPSLGWNVQGFTGPGDHLDGEAEPSLGSLNSCGRGSSQAVWACGSRSDRESDVGDEAELNADQDGDGEFMGGDLVDDVGDMARALHTEYYAAFERLQAAKAAEA